MPLPHLRTQRSSSPASVSMSRRALLGTGLGAGLAFALAGCGSFGGVAGEADAITWAWQLPTTWDPVTSSAGSDVQMLALTYDSITRLDERGNAVGWLAESWRHDADGTRVTFRLRPGLRFADGSPVDAAAVAASIERGRSQAGSLIAPQMTDLKKVSASGDLDVVLELSRTNYQYPLLFAGKTGMVVNPGVFEKGKRGVDSLATRPAGSGPFRLTSYVQNDHAELTRNEHFHLADQIQVSSFALYPQPDPATAVASALSGQYNVVRIPASLIDSARSAGLEVQVLDSTFVSVLDVNTGMAPFTEPAVVEAMKYGIDRANIKKVGNFGVGDVNVQPFPKGYVGHADDVADSFDYDPARARKILRDAGISGSVTGTLSAQAPVPSAVEQIQAQLKAIGIDLDIDVVPKSQWTQLVYIDRSKALGYDGFAGRESPVQAFQVLFSSTGLMNPARNDDDELEAAVERIRRTPLEDPSYAATVAAATKVAVRTFPNTFLYDAPYIVARQKSVSPLERNPSLVRFEGISA